ncbi:MAG: hypothetical protein KKF89_04885 [Nanoarchaeota archaeon]|nr:hypothetical protein [Nanoarchaeota archaeon]MBU1855029.1 hypothetical protein [Nanoarchaeota archaeon]
MILLDITKFEVTVSKHAIFQALEREIDPDIIEKSIRKSKIRRFGKNNIKFSTNKIVCVGEIRGLEIVIFTVYKK